MQSQLADLKQKLDLIKRHKVTKFKVLNSEKYVQQLNLN